MEENAVTQDTRGSDHQGQTGNRLAISGIFTLQNVFIILLILAIVILAVFFRSSMLHYFGFYEPDGFYHFSVIRAAVLNNFVIPTYLSISGWPHDTPVTEPFGLYWMTLIPYYFLRFVGISYYTIERWIALVFGVLTVIAMYFLARTLSKDKLFAIMAMALIALSMGDAARTSALIYRGDSFISLFLIVSLIMLIHAFNAQDRNRKIVYAIIAAFVLSLGNIVWNGASFTTVVYLFAVVIMLVLGFLLEDEKLIANVRYAFIMLAVWFVLVTIYTALHFNYPEALTGGYFLAVYALLLAGWCMVYYLQKNKSRFHSLVGSVASRLGVVSIMVVVSIAAIFIIPGFYSRIFVQNGFANGGSFAVTIQELSPPTYQFLYASFGPVLFTTPMTLVMALATINYSLRVVFWLVVLACLLLYLFMQAYDSKGFFGGNARARLELKESMLLVASYFAITAFLQMSVIRFNSLIAIPMAVLSAYTIYWLAMMFKGLWDTKVSGIAAGIVTGLGLFTVLILTLVWTHVPALWMALAMLISILVLLLFIFTPTGKKALSASTTMGMLAGLLIILVFFAVLVYTDIQYTQGLTQADSMNPQLFAATAWLKNNTPSNAVILTLWPDGSVVEGVSNRTSVMDSVGSQNATKSLYFARWIFNSSSDPQFLLGNITGRPDYLLVRYVWLAETSGIYTEADFAQAPQNSSAYYAYATFSGVAENMGNTIISTRFTSQQGYVGYLNMSIQTLSELPMQTNISGQGTRAYLAGQQGISPLSEVVIYNVNTGNYSVISPGGFNQTNGQVLLATYSQVPSPSLPVNFTSAYLFNTGIGFSNMVKFLYECSSYSCVWNNNIASMKLVYANGDSRIYQISYNSTP